MDTAKNQNTARYNDDEQNIIEIENNGVFFIPIKKGPTVPPSVRVLILNQKTMLILLRLLEHKNVDRDPTLRCDLGVTRPTRHLPRYLSYLSLKYYQLR